MSLLEASIKKKGIYVVFKPFQKEQNIAPWNFKGIFEKKLQHRLKGSLFP